MMALACIASIQASARCLRIDKNAACPEIGSTAYYQDDDNSRQYIVITDCEGNTCRKPFTGPIQPQRVVGLPITVPTNWQALTDQSLAITTPGAEIPLYFTDANGFETHFRNPIDSAEDALYQMLYLTHEKGGMGKAAPPMNDIHIDPKELYPEDPDWRISKELFGRYLDVKYPPGTVTTEAEDEENAPIDLGVMAMLDETHSNLAIRQMPSQGNAMQLIVVPIARELASPITVTRVDGTLVWSGGDMSEPSTIDLSGQPSGMYFVRGLGKSLVVQVVK
jgi:hypothetical protein